MRRIFAIVLEEPPPLGSIVRHDFVEPGINLMVSGVAEFTREDAE